MFHQHVPPAAGQVSLRQGEERHGHMTDSQALRRLARQARPYYPRLILAIVFGAATGLLMVVPFVEFGRIIDGVIRPITRAQGQADLSALYWGLAAIYVSIVLANIATYGTSYTTTWCGQ